SKRKRNEGRRGKGRCAAHPEYRRSKILAKDFHGGSPVTVSVARGLKTLRYANPERLRERAGFLERDALAGFRARGAAASPTSTTGCPASVASAVSISV